jgi:hypothetical protein
VSGFARSEIVWESSAPDHELKPGPDSRGTSPTMTLFVDAESLPGVILGLAPRLSGSHLRAVSGTFASPLGRGRRGPDVEKHTHSLIPRRVRGQPRMPTSEARPPHPNPLPGGGEREKRAGAVDVVRMSCLNASRTTPSPLGEKVAEGRMRGPPACSAAGARPPHPDPLPVEKHTHSLIPRRVRGQPRIPTSGARPPSPYPSPRRGEGIVSGFARSAIVWKSSAPDHELEPGPDSRGTSPTMTKLGTTRSKQREVLNRCLLRDEAIIELCFEA